MKTQTYIFTLTILGIIVGSCKDSTSIISSNLENPFGVTIAVKDTAGQPVPGLRISAWNTFNGIVLAKQKNIYHPFSTQAVSRTLFDLPNNSRVTFDVWDLNNTLVKTFIDRQWLAAGYHAVDFSIDTLLPTRVYKVRTAAEDSSAHIVYKDSIYAVLWQPDAERSILGGTSPLGTFETHDTLLFPNSLTLPPLKHTTVEGPTVDTTFTISDSVVIVLADTVHNKFQVYHRVVQKGMANIISLTWNPSTMETEISSFTKPSIKPENIFDVIPVPGLIPTQYKLHQNYPNPFN
jgi:hypothetical protein